LLGAFVHRTPGNDPAGSDAFAFLPECRREMCPLGSALLTANGRGRPPATFMCTVRGRPTIPARNQQHHVERPLRHQPQAVRVSLSHFLPRSSRSVFRSGAIALGVRSESLGVATRIRRFPIPPGLATSAFAGRPQRRQGERTACGACWQAVPLGQGNSGISRLPFTKITRPYGSAERSF